MPTGFWPKRTFTPPIHVTQSQTWLSASPPLSTTSRVDARARAWSALFARAEAFSGLLARLAQQRWQLLQHGLQSCRRAWSEGNVFVLAFDLERWPVGCFFLPVASFVAQVQRCCRRPFERSRKFLRRAPIGLTGDGLSPSLRLPFSNGQFFFF